MRNTSRFALLVLGTVLLVILWGAYVRATGSGAGCGSNWPLCNGEVLPRAPAAETLVELTHRISSGIALLLVVVLVVLVFRRFPRGHAARLGAVWSLTFMLTEAGVGAGLVLFELVAENESMARGLFMAVHLINTFLLLAALSLTWLWSTGHRRPRRILSTPPGRLLLLAHLALLVVGMSGVISALGDTLFPAETLREALRQDLSPTAHLFVRLRKYHPLLAVIAGLGVMVLPRWIEERWSLRGDRRLGEALGLLVLVQVAVGIANVALLAPIWLQLVHLLLADLLWITLVLFSASVLIPAQGSGAPAAG
ncbi:MAG: COX15/CtaA family protein [Thermoanaerobaculia bacterium]|nr:COX15/CtaA family protein [Thermoanaerobaculia bacterium]